MRKRRTSLIRSQRQSPHRLAVYPQDEPEHIFVIKKPDVDGNFGFKAALFGEDITIGQIHQEDIPQCTQGRSLLNGDHRTPEEGSVGLSTQTTGGHIDRDASSSYRQGHGEKLRFDFLVDKPDGIRPALCE